MANGSGEGQQHVAIKSGPFGISLTGRDSILILLFLSIVGLAALTLTVHGARSKEHEQIMCSTKLAIFVYTTPREQSGRVEIDWSKMPVDLYGCVPKFLYEKPR